MAQAAMLNAEQSTVQILALKMVQAQESEIAYMEKWLSDRGYERTQQ